MSGSSITLRIPAMGHIHSAACNHDVTGKGNVRIAANAGDVAALEAALAAGGSTEDTDGVRKVLESHPALTVTMCFSCYRPSPHSVLLPYKVMWTPSASSWLRAQT